jgi:Spy/CpxP family protein refolding chaperone
MQQDAWREFVPAHSTVHVSASAANPPRAADRKGAPMTKARTAFAIAILLAIALPLTMVAQTEAPPAQPQGQMGEQHDHMGRMGGPPTPQQHLDHLSQMLNLTDDQKAEIKPILENEATQVKSLFQDTSMSPQDRHTKMRGIHDTTMGQIRPLLTSDQQAKLDSMKEHEGMGRGKGMGHDHIKGPKADGQQPPPPPPQ